MSEQIKCSCGSVLTAEEIQYYGHSCNACEQKELVEYLESMNKTGCAVTISKHGYHRIKQHITTLHQSLSSAERERDQARLELERVRAELESANKGIENWGGKNAVLHFEKALLESAFDDIETLVKGAMLSKTGPSASDFAEMEIGWNNALNMVLDYLRKRRPATQEPS